MYSLLKKFSDVNPERFNHNFIMSRNDQDVLEYAIDIFKGLEILDEFEVESVTLDTDESSFGPIKNQHRYYKSILPSRVNKIHYRVKITPSENAVNKSPLFNKKNAVPDSGSFIKEGDIFVNKLIDNVFYINEGVRYFLIYQIVDNATYGVRESVVLKSLFMPITAQKNDIVVTPEFCEESVDVPSFELQLFSRKINPVLYVLGKAAYNIIKDNTDVETTIDDRRALESDGLIDALKDFFQTDFTISKDIPLDVDVDTHYTFKLHHDAEPSYITVSKTDFDENVLTRALIGCLSHIPSDTKKKPIMFSYSELHKPWFWIDKLSDFLTKNAADEKKFEKVKAVLISLNRLVDDATRKALDIDDDDKKDTFAVIRYMMRDFDILVNEDSRDLENKRVRLLEYQMYPLRKYFSEQIYRVLNSPNRSRIVLERVLSGLSPMFVIKQTVVNELLRYYNSANEMNLYSSLLKYTFRGPQAIGKSVSNEQRDLHPSYTGRLSLIASSAGDPGISGSMTPFVQMDGYHFKKKS